MNQTILFLLMAIIIIIVIGVIFYPAERETNNINNAGDPKTDTWSEINTK